MIYTLEAAAKKCGVEPINIMELVLLGKLNIYSVDYDYDPAQDYPVSFDRTQNELYDLPSEIALKIAHGFVYKGESLKNNSQLVEGCRFIDAELKKVMPENTTNPIVDTKYQLPDPKQENDWNLCITTALKEFYTDNNYPAETPEEVIQRLLKKPPHGYTIKVQSKRVYSFADDSFPKAWKNLKRIISRRIENQESYT